MERTQSHHAHLCVRLDEALRKRLIAEAKRSVRSLNGEIIFRLRRSIEAQEDRASEPAP
jgi:predicted HicB family RNase H-like nuclease